jgi:general secretion pathway protein D
MCSPSVVYLEGCASRAPAGPAATEASAEVAAQSGAAQAVEVAGEPVEPRSPMIVRGSGALIGTPPSAPPVRRLEGQGFQLSFVDTEISAVVAAVLGDALNVPYSVDPQIQGTMSLQATRPLSAEELLASLESALRVHGAALVPSAGGFSVVTLTDATRRISSLRISRSEPGFGVYIVPLQYVSAEAMEETLQPFAPDGGILRVDRARNLLLLAGTSQEIATLLNVIQVFDVDWLAGMSFALYPLEYVDAKTVASELEAVFAQESPIDGVVRFVPLERLNSLLIVTPRPQYLEQVEAWIERLDLGAATPGRRIYVYDVQNGKADDLSDSLNDILSLDTGFSTGAGTAESLVSDELPQDSGGPEVAREQGEGQALDAGALRIVPSAENNSLLILASPSEFAVIEAALKRLDVLPIQVLIEASIAEVTLNNDLRFGIQWAYEGGDGPIVLSESPTGSINPQFPGFSYLVTDRPGIRAVLNAIESLTDVRVLSSPKLMVLNNREAQLSIGDQVPIVTQSAVAVVDPDAPIVNAVEFRDTGVILRVTPRANKSGRIILEIAQEVSDVAATTTSGIDSPTIQQRKIESTVAVRNGETIALGGLIREFDSRTRSGVPFLQRIPGLGSLFGSTDNSNRRTELIVLLTPRVIRSDQEAVDVMNELREQFEELHDVIPAWSAGAIPPATSEPPASQ